MSSRMESSWLRLNKVEALGEISDTKRRRGAAREADERFFLCVGERMSRSAYRGGSCDSICYRSHSGPPFALSQRRGHQELCDRTLAPPPTYTASYICGVAQ
ncbi:uncharacterized [Tachysurus ichikawai]